MQTKSCACADLAACPPVSSFHFWQRAQGKSVRAKHSEDKKKACTGVYLNILDHAGFLFHAAMQSYNAFAPPTSLISSIHFSQFSSTIAIDGFGDQSLL